MHDSAGIAVTLIGPKGEAASSRADVQGPERRRKGAIRHFADTIAGWRGSPFLRLAGHLHWALLLRALAPAAVSSTSLPKAWRSAMA